MRELVVISGKGGTGKTSLTASFAVLAQSAVVADCDVDAADLPLVLAPEIRRREEFHSGHEAVIRQVDCVRCGVCATNCRFEAVGQFSGENGAPAPRGPHSACKGCDFCQRSCSVRTREILREMWEAAGSAGQPIFAIDCLACEGCGVCVRSCPVHAIDFPERTCGEWFVSDTRCGPLVYARLCAAGENSGKLVSLVRAQAREIAQASGRELIIIDGAPGIGCPVIASLTGVTAALIVTEPTVSGQHDLERVAGVARHFGVPTWVCVNKWDLNPEMAEHIEAAARRQGMQVAGRVRYDKAVTAAQVAARTIVEFTADGVAADVRVVWNAFSAAHPMGPSCVPAASRHGAAIAAVGSQSDRSSS
jgi:MinD superfamily P-loop ATPase